MSKPDGGPAFPDEGIPGMTLRDYFAIQIAAAAHGDEARTFKTLEAWSKEAYTLADALIAEREKA